MRNGKLTKVLISIIFIALGIGSVIEAVMNIFDGKFDALLGIDCVLGVLMFVLGILGVFGSSLKLCKIIAVIVCLLSMTIFVITVFTFDLAMILSGIITTFSWALLAWIYFDIE